MNGNIRKREQKLTTSKRGGKECPVFRNSFKVKGILFSLGSLQHSPFVICNNEPIQQRWKESQWQVNRGNIAELEKFNTRVRVCKDKIEEETTVCTLHHLSSTVCCFFFLSFYLQLCLFPYFYSSLSVNHSRVSNRCAEQ